MTQNDGPHATDANGVDVGFEVEDGRTLYLVVGCPECEEKRRVPASAIRVRDGVRCSCGSQLFRFQGRSVVHLEQALEDMLHGLKPRRLNRLDSDP